MSNQDKIEVLTPTGRLVFGDCFKGNTTDAEGRPLVYKSGPNQGQPREEYILGIAIPKTGPESAKFQEIYTKMVQVANRAFPNVVDAGGNIQPGQKFAWKLTDGDSTIPNTKGVKPCDREGYPGHWVLTFSGSFAPTCYTTGGASKIVDPEAIKRGYYIRIYGSITDNGSSQQPGLFLNHSMVELVGYGEIISSGPDGASVFGGAPAGALPPGASVAPIATSTPIATPNVGPAVTAPATPILAPASAPVQTNVVQPAPDFLNGPATTQAPPPPPPVVEQFNIQGTLYTREKLRSFNWTDAQIDASPRA